MSITEVAGRIQEIQGQLALLAPRTVPSSTGPVGSGRAGAASAGDFAGVLAGIAPSATRPAEATGANITTPTTAGATAEQRVVDEARKYLGVPYLWGGTDPDKGLDCSGLVQLVYRSLGVELPRVSYQQARAGRPVPSLVEARPGDILAFNNPVNHVGIYIGDGKMIEAPRTGLDVRVVEVYEAPTAIRRVLPAASDGGTTQAARVAGSLPAGTPYAGLFEQAGRRHGVDPTLLAAVARQESGFDPGAVSPAGARGLMQLMPATAEGLGVRNAFDPAQAVDGAARLLRDLIREFGRVDLALAAYNAGPGAVHRYGGIPPYRETQHYVPAVLAHQRDLVAA